MTGAHSIPVVGQHAQPRRFGPVTRTDIVRYAGASGDFNPLHHDDEYARSAGFTGVFSMGMLQAGLLASYATDWLGASSIRRYHIRFAAQVWPGDMLEFGGLVTACRASAAGVIVEVELVCKRSGAEAIWAGNVDFAETVLTGSAAFELH